MRRLLSAQSRRLHSRKGACVKTYNNMRISRSCGTFSYAHRGLAQSGFKERRARLPVESFKGAAPSRYRKSRDIVELEHGFSRSLPSVTHFWSFAYYCMSYLKRGVCLASTVQRCSQIRYKASRLTSSL